MFKNISDYDNINDFLPIMVGSVVMYALTIIIIIIKKKYYNLHNSNNENYNIFKLETVLRDNLLYVMSLSRIRFIYSTLIIYLPTIIKYIPIFNHFSFLLNYNLYIFLFFGFIIQLINDYLLSYFNLNPKNHMLIIKENKNLLFLTNSFITILLILFSSYFASFSVRTNLSLLMNIIYIIPYLTHLL